MLFKISRKAIPVKVIVAGAFLTLRLTTVLVINFYLLKSQNASARKNAAENAAKMNRMVEERISQYMQIPVNINEISGKMLQSGTGSFDDQQTRDQFFAGIVRTYPEDLYAYGFVAADGAYYGAYRNNAGKIELKETEAGNPQKVCYFEVNQDLSRGDLKKTEERFDGLSLGWYQTAVRKAEPSYSSVYRCSLISDLAVAAVLPVYDHQNQLEGVINARLRFADINKKLDDLMAGYDGNAVILERETGYLIANSYGIRNYELSGEDSFKREKMDRLRNPVLEDAYRQYQKKSVRQQYVQEKEGDLFICFQEYQYKGLDWIIITSVSDKVLEAELHRNIMMSAFFCTGSIAVFIMMYIFFYRRLISPIYRLAGAAEKFSSGELDIRIPVFRNDEIGRISVAFNHAAEKLQYLVNHLEELVESRNQELQETNQTLAKSKARLRLILDTAVEGILMLDLEGRCTFCNISASHLLGGQTAEDMLGKEMRQFLPRQGNYDGSIEQSREEMEKLICRNDGTSFLATCQMAAIVENGRQAGYVVTFVDNTRRKKEEEQIRFLSQHDTLTGLKNRCFYNEKLEQIEQRENLLPVSVIFMDLNGLKLMNDVYGHAAGDCLLREAAALIQSVCRQNDVAARIGGDEYIVLLPETEERQARDIADRIKKGFMEKRIHGIRCSMAAGVSTRNQAYQKMESVVELAENEMYKDKSVTRKKFSQDALEGMICSLHEKCPGEKKHSEQVERLCGKIGKAMNLPEEEIARVKRAGYLHDIGKAGLPEKLFHADQKQLTEKEREMMHQHPAIGYRILNLSGDTADLAEAVMGHHERWDGKGYPRGLKKNEIHRISRIIRIADMFDRICSADEYSEAGIRKAYRVIQEGAGSQFDPQMAELFISLKTGPAGQQEA